MSYQGYEDYMRSVLGYSPYVPNDYTYTDEQEDIYSYSNDMMQMQPVQDLSPFYPEIYKIIYPMVCKVCNVNLNRELTKELLEQMTDEIYKNGIDEKILVQGIIDLYFIDQNDNLVLLDYKTDYVEKEEDLIAKYKMQLNIYKTALEEALNRKVNEVYIYSTWLDKIIKVQN